MRIFTYVFLTLLVSVAIGFINQKEVSAGATVWQGKQIVKIAEGPAQPVSYEASKCSTEMTLIEVEQRDGHVSACIFGQPNALRLARYTHAGGQFGYAVAFPTDTKFTPVRNLCTGLPWCAYGQSEDTLLLSTSIGVWHWGQAFIKDFSKYLTLHKDTHRYYTFDYTSEYIFLGAENVPFATNAVSVSANGRWALVELRSYGFVRVDLRTLETRRVVAPGATYGLANDPSFETTITNDGKKIAITGWRSGISVYEITDNCGDTLTPVMQEYFQVYISPCPEATIDRYALFPNFSFGQVPRFSTDQSTLSMYINTTYGTVAVRLSPKSSDIAKAHYVAYGDSFTSGEGELDDSFYLAGTNTTTNTCHVSARSYPFLLQKQWENTMVSNRACSGSRIEDVRNVLRSDSSIASSPHATILSLGIGGNDVGLMAKLKTCLQPGTCEWVQPERRAATANEIRRLLQPLITLIQQMQQENAGSPVLVMGYPEVINDAHTASCDALINTLLSQEERVYMNESIRYLNTIIRAAARYTNTRFINVEQALRGERLCEGNSKAMNTIRLGDDIAPIPFMKTKFIGAESFHPTPYGHTLISNVAEAQLTEGFWETSVCGSCTFKSSQIEPSEYWLENVQAEWLDVRQFTLQFIDNLKIFGGSFVDLTFPVGTFRPYEAVQIELHSDTVSLGSYEALEDGSMRARVKFPSGTTGYHTVHALGDSVSGDALDIYQVVYIEDENNQGNLSEESSTPVSTEVLPSGTTSRAITDRVALKSTNIQPTDILDAHSATIPAVLGLNQVPVPKKTHESSRKDEPFRPKFEFVVTYLVLAGVSIGALVLLYWLVRRNAPK